MMFVYVDLRPITTLRAFCFVQGCADADAEKARHFFDTLYEGDGIMSGDPEVKRVMECIMAIDAKLTKRDADLRDADARCNAKREEDKIEWQDAMDQLRIEQKNALTQLHDEFISRMEAQEAGHAEKIRNFQVNAAMIAFRQIAIDIRNYYACEVGGVTIKPNKQLDPIELKIFLEKVSQDTGTAAKLAKRIKEDKNPWTWDDIRNFCLFANDYAHPSIGTGNRLTMNDFLDRDDLHITVEKSHMKKRGIKTLLKSFLESYDQIFRSF